MGGTCSSGTRQIQATSDPMGNAGGRETTPAKSDLTVYLQYSPLIDLVMFIAQLSLFIHTFVLFMKAALGSLISPFNVLSLLVSISRDALTYSREENSQLQKNVNREFCKSTVSPHPQTHPPPPPPPPPLNIGSHNNMLLWLERCPTGCWLGRLSRTSGLKGGNCKIDL